MIMQLLFPFLPKGLCKTVTDPTFHTECKHRLVELDHLHKSRPAPDTAPYQLGTERCQATTTLLAVTLVLDHHALYELTWSQATF